MSVQTKRKGRSRAWPVPKESGLVRETTEYKWALEELGQGREVSFKAPDIPRILRSGEAMCQALRRFIRSRRLPFRVYSRKGTIYIQRV